MNEPVSRGFHDSGWEASFHPDLTPPPYGGGDSLLAGSEAGQPRQTSLLSHCIRGFWPLRDNGVGDAGFPGMSFFSRDPLVADERIPPSSIRAGHMELDRSER